MDGRHRFLLQRTLEIAALLGTAIAVTATSPAGWRSAEVELEIEGRIDWENPRWIRVIEVRNTLPEGLPEPTMTSTGADVGSWWIDAPVESLHPLLGAEIDPQPRWDGPRATAGHLASPGRPLEPAGGPCELSATPCRVQHLLAVWPAESAWEWGSSLEMRARVWTVLWGRRGYAAPVGLEVQLSELDPWTVEAGLTGTLLVDDTIVSDQTLVEWIIEGETDLLPNLAWADLEVEATLDTEATTGRTLLLIFRNFGLPTPGARVTLQVEPSANSHRAILPLTFPQGCDGDCTAHLSIEVQSDSPELPAVDIEWSLEVGIAGVPDPLRAAPSIELRVLP